MNILQNFADHNQGSLGKTCIMAALFVFWTLCILPIGLGAAGLAFLFSLRAKRPVWLEEGARRFITFYGRGMLFLLRPWMPVYIRHGAMAQEQGPCVLVVNHQSFLDLYLLGAQAQSNLCLVSKSWPYKKLFFFAPIMRLAGYIDAEALPAQEVARLCLLRLQQGATVVFFPEGTRSKDGKLQKFHVGAFALACEAKVPVVPMLIKNAWQVFPRGAKFFKPRLIEMQLLAPVDWQKFAHEDLPHRALSRYVRQLFMQHLT